MATASNTQFKVENGLFVVGTANVSGSLRVEGDLVVGGNLASALNITGDFKPTANLTYNLGSNILRWGIIGGTANFSNTLTVSGDSTLNTATTGAILPSANNIGLGSATRRWDFYANNVNAVTTGVSSNATLANVTISNTLSIGLIVANQTTLVLGNTQFTVNTGSKLSIVASGNATYSNLTLTNDVTAIAGNVAFDTDLITLDATNNRIGLKTALASLSTSALATITGNLEFNTVNTGIRLQTSNTSMNAAVMMTGNTTNTRVTFSTFDSGISGTTSGGYIFNGTNATATQTLLDLNSTSFQYKSGNVAYSGNFGVYDVSGTRLGP
jgi:hypothetical protein